MRNGVCRVVNADRLFSRKNGNGLGYMILSMGSSRCVVFLLWCIGYLALGNCEL